MGELARFLFQRGHYAPGKRVVKPGAFLPKNGHTSVFEIVGLPEQKIRKIGIAAGAAREREPRARGELTRANVRDVGLRFERDDVPLLHGNLVGWPSEDNRRKDLNKDVARRLAQTAVLVLHN